MPSLYVSFCRIDMHLISLLNFRTYHSFPGSCDSIEHFSFGKNFCGPKVTFLCYIK
jgi:hypothetical protein